MEEEYGEGDESQIHRNDGIFKAIMLLAGLPLNSFSRNTHIDRKGQDRPDFVISNGNVPILICEEKGV